ncbi:hypothetical protein D3C72_1714940 [compost metagenome]
MLSLGWRFSSSQAGTTLCTGEAEPPPRRRPFMSAGVLGWWRLVSKQMPAGQRVLMAPIMRILPPLARLSTRLIGST